jgi:hypothetical protein
MNCVFGVAPVPAAPPTAAGAGTTPSVLRSSRSFNLGSSGPPTLGGHPHPLLTAASSNALSSAGGPVSFRAPTADSAPVDTVAVGVADASGVAPAAAAPVSAQVLGSLREGTDDVASDTDAASAADTAGMPSLAIDTCGLGGAAGDGDAGSAAAIQATPTPSPSNGGFGAPVEAVVAGGCQQDCMRVAPLCRVCVVCVSCVCRVCAVTAP